MVKAYGIPGARVDGMDVLEVREAAQKAVEYCRAGKGPYILEMITYRYRGHSMSDPAKYRSKEEVTNMKEKHDPIDYIKNLLIAGNYLTEDELKSLDKDIKKVITGAADFAAESPLPDASELWTDVLA